MPFEQVVQGKMDMSRGELKFVLQSLLQLYLAKDTSKVEDAATLLDADKARLQEEIEKNGAQFREWLVSPSGEKVIAEYLVGHNQQAIESGTDFESLVASFRKDTAH